jgi:hypothetical protein
VSSTKPIPEFLSMLVEIGRPSVVSAHKHPEGPGTAKSGLFRRTSVQTSRSSYGSGATTYGRAFHRSRAGAPLSSPSTETVPVSSGKCTPRFRSNLSHRIVSALSAWP